MRLLRDSEAPEGGSLTTFRTSSIGAFVGASVVSAVTGGMYVGLYLATREVGGLGWIPFVPFALIVAVLAWWMLSAAWGGFAASLRASNWTLRVGKGGVWLHLRSFLNHAFEDADETAAFLGFGELECARKVVERQRSGLSSSSDARVAMLELVVAPSSTEALREAVARERLRNGPTRGCLGVTSRTRSMHVPVLVAGPGRVRVQWHGRRMLRELAANGVAIRPTVRGRLGATDDAGRAAIADAAGVDRATVDGEILALVERGKKIQAIGLVRETYGMGLAEAKAFVEELQGTSAA